MGNRYMRAECLYCYQGGKRWEQASTMLLRRYPEKISRYPPCYFLWDMDIQHARYAHRYHESFRPPNQTKEIVRKSLKEDRKIVLEGIQKTCTNRTSMFSFLALHQSESGARHSSLCGSVWLLWAVPTCIQLTRVWSETGYVLGGMDFGLSNLAGCVCW